MKIASLVPIMLLISLLAAPSAHAIDKSQIYLITGTVADDFASTVSTKGREANPAMPDNWKGQAAMMAGSTALMLTMGKMFRDLGHPKAAKVLNYIVGSVHFGAAGLNFRLGLK